MRCFSPVFMLVALMSLTYFLRFLSPAHAAMPLFIGFPHYSAIDYPDAFAFAFYFFEDDVAVY